MAGHPRHMGRREGRRSSVPYFKFVEPTDNGAALLRWAAAGKEEEQAVPWGEREGRGSRWLCWRLGRGQLEVGR